MITIDLNGEPRVIAQGATVKDLIASLGLDAQQVAVERNKEIVRRADHAVTVLVDGDRVELVTLFGGG